MKKREILNDLNGAITTLAALSGDCAKLEVMDNDEASRRLKRDLVEFREGPFKKLVTNIYGIREEIRDHKKERKINKNNNQKTNQHESESEQ